MTPIKFTLSGAGIVAAPATPGLPTSGLVAVAKGIADGSVALDVELWVAPQKTATTNGAQLAHFKAIAGAADTLNLTPTGINVADQQYLLAKFNDAGVAHELWVYFD